jgi:hypothetical protein
LTEEAKKDPTVKTADPDEVNRMIGELPKTEENAEIDMDSYIFNCKCPTCRQIAERKKQIALDQEYFRLSKGN